MGLGVEGVTGMDRWNIRYKQVGYKRSNCSTRQVGSMKVRVGRIVVVVVKVMV